MTDEARAEAVARAIRNEAQWVGLHMADTLARAAIAAYLTAGESAEPVGEPITIAYTNYAGKFYPARRIVPKSVWFGTTEWHPEPQWFLKAIDVEKGERDFALRDIAHPPAPEPTQPAGDDAELVGRATTAAVYRLCCSPHEWTNEDSLSMANYVLFARDRIEALTARNGKLEDLVDRLERMLGNIGRQNDRAVMELLATCAERNRLREALTRIAAFDDLGSNNLLEQRGSYVGFDEPGSVEIAREALQPVTIKEI